MAVYLNDTKLARPYLNDTKLNAYLNGLKVWGDNVNPWPDPTPVPNIGFYYNRFSSVTYVGTDSQITNMQWQPIFYALSGEPLPSSLQLYWGYRVIPYSEFGVPLTPRNIMSNVPSSLNVTWVWNDSCQLYRASDVINNIYLNWEVPVSSEEQIIKIEITCRVNDPNGYPFKMFFNVYRSYLSNSIMDFEIIPSGHKFSTDDIYTFNNSTNTPYLPWANGQGVISGANDWFGIKIDNSFRYSHFISENAGQPPFIHLWDIKDDGTAYRYFVRPGPNNQPVYSFVRPNAIFFNVTQLEFTANVTNTSP